MMKELKGSSLRIVLTKTDVLELARSGHEFQFYLMLYISVYFSKTLKSILGVSSKTHA